MFAHTRVPSEIPGSCDASSSSVVSTLKSCATSSAVLCVLAFAGICKNPFLYRNFVCFLCYSRIFTLDSVTAPSLISCLPQWAVDFGAGSKLVCSGVITVKVFQSLPSLCRLL